MGVLLCVIGGCASYSWDQGVIRVSVDFQGQNFIRFERSHCSSMLMYSCK